LRIAEAAFSKGRMPILSPRQQCKSIEGEHSVTLWQTPAKLKTYRGFLLACSGTGWCRLLSVLPRTDTRSSPVASARDGFVGLATARHGSRLHAAGPYDATPKMPHTS